MQGYSPPLSFAERLDQAINTSDYTDLLKFLSTSPNQCKSDPSSLMRLLNNLSRLSLTEEINRVFIVLIRIGFTFYSIEFVEPLGRLIDKDNTTTQLSVLEALIRNKVMIDASLIQRALEACFNKVEEMRSESAAEQEGIIRITKSVLADPSNYLTLDFVKYLLTKLLDAG